MQALIIPFSHADTDIQFIIKRLLDLKKDFQVKDLDAFFTETDSSSTIWDNAQHTAVRKRLTHTYVKSGAWNSMNDDERQDAALLEKMMFQEEKANYTVHSVDESAHILANLKAELHGD